MNRELTPEKSSGVWNRRLVRCAERRPRRRNRRWVTVTRPRPQRAEEICQRIVPKHTAR